MNKFVQLHSNDDVVISLEEIHKGQSLQIQTEDSGMIHIKASDDIPKGHKMSVKPVKRGGT